MVPTLNCSFKQDFKCSKDTLRFDMKEIYLCTKLTSLQRCCHYLMITPRSIKRKLVFHIFLSNIGEETINVYNFGDSSYVYFSPVLLKMVVRKELRALYAEFC